MYQNDSNNSDIIDDDSDNFDGNDLHDGGNDKNLNNNN